MRTTTKTKAFVRFLGLTAVAIMIGGSVSYAALISQQNTLTGNTIQTTTASLQLSKDGTNYSDSHTGFDFNNLVPGGAAMPITGYGFYLKNAGGTPLSLKLAVSSTPTNPNGVDLSKVNVLLTTVGAGISPQSFTLQSLMSSSGQSVTGANLASGSSQQYKLQVQMAADAVNGSGASLGNIDFAFSGTAVSN